jgi:tetratricopeptide (TPR) repeat protein
MDEERMINAMQVCDAFLVGILGKRFCRMSRIVPLNGSLKGLREIEMLRGLSRSMLRAAWLGLGAACFAAALSAQTAPADNSQKPAATQQNPPASQPKPADANQFPDDTTTVPVMPTKDTPALPDGTYGGDDNARSVPLPAADNDPVRSPDDAASPASEGATEVTSSDSNAGMDKLLGDPNEDGSETRGKHRKMDVPGPEHKETSAEDIEVGKYQLEIKNWKGALSRFQSAMVLSPDDPDVYWGLAESSRHLGKLAEARGYYQKVAEYDPDSKHGKESIKALKEPEIANAKAQVPASPAK